MSAARIIRRLRDLMDVDTSGVSDGDALTYDAGSDTWIPAAAGGPDTDDQTAAEVPFTPAGTIAATDVQAALVELDSEKAALAHAHDGGDITTGTVADARIASTIARDSEVSSAITTSESGQVRDGDAAGGVLGGTYPNPSFAADMATQAELDAHTADATAAHAATAIAYTPTGSIAATNVQDAIDEAVSEVVAGAPTGADYLVGTAQGGLSAEIVVGTSPGGELGGTWASPTVDATHSGSSHASVQSAAEATAAAALSAHEADTTSIHGIADTSALVTTARTITAGSGLAGGGTLAADRTLDVNVDGSTLEINADALRVKDGGITSAKIADGTIAVGDLAFDPATQTELDAHVNDTTDAHDASAISVLDTDAHLASTNVEDALAELYLLGASGDTDLADHIVDTTDVHGITDTSTLYRAGGTDVALADGGTGASLVDPNADRVMFWDDSAGVVTWLTMGTNLTITGTTLDASAGSTTANDVSLIVHMEVFA